MREWVYEFFFFEPISDYFISFFFIYTAPFWYTSAVTYDFSGGRFGDNLVSYCHAKWISYKYNIPLLYKPFDYSDQLMMDVLEIPYSDDLEKQFENIVNYSKTDEEL